MSAALSFDGEWTIARASELHGQLLAALLEGEQGTAWPALDLSGVESMDSSGVQLLLALRRSLQERGQDLVIRSASAAVLAALDVYRLRDLLLTEAIA